MNGNRADEEKLKYQLLHFADLDNFKNIVSIEAFVDHINMDTSENNYTEKYLKNHDKILCASADSTRMKNSKFSECTFLGERGHYFRFFEWPMKLFIDFYIEFDKKQVL